MKRISLLILAALLLALLLAAGIGAAQTDDDTAIEQTRAAEAEAGALPYEVYLPFVMPCDDPDSPIMCYIKGPGW